VKKISKAEFSFIKHLDVEFLKKYFPSVKDIKT
jgi:hypothetical protein